MNDPPRRLPLGSDAVGFAIAKGQEQIAEAERWADLSRSTDFPA